MTANDNTPHTESTGSLFSDAIKQISTLIRGEVDLARAEIDQNLRRALTAVGLLVGAMVVALVSLNVLAAAVVSGLNEAGLDAGWAAVIVGAVLGAIAFVMISKGTSDLKLSSLAPSRTAENIKRDTRAVTGGEKNV